VSRRRPLERRRVVGSEVAVGDYFEVEGASCLWRVDKVRADGGNVCLTFALLGGNGRWLTVVGGRSRVHVWREASK
jgi:hypothetical protein